MKRFLLFLLVLSVNFGAIAQSSLKQANNYFDKYEYAAASSLFASYSESHKLSYDDFKKLTYCYYVVGDFENCARLSDSIAKRRDSEPFFHYMNGEANLAIGELAKAKNAFVYYQKKDKEFDVTSRIQTINLRASWEETSHVENGLFGANSTKADMTGPNYSFGSIEFYEVGEDSSGKFINRDVVNASELLLNRPFVKKSETEILPIQFEKKFRDVVVTSFTLDEKTNEVWLTVAQPLKKKKMDKAPHIYAGLFDPKAFSITELKRWEYSGYEDSSACAHATLNASGDMLVFSKLKSSKQDADLYISKKKSGSWTKPTLLQSLSTSGNEMYPLFMGDNLLSYSSDGRAGYGGLDIFTSSISNKIFSESQHLKAPINSSNDDFNFRTISADSAIYSSNRTQGSGDDDKYLIVYARPVIPVLTEFEEFVVEWTKPILYFNYNKSTILQYDKIEELIVFLEANPESNILIEGHTDMRGKASYNFKLALQRAQAVKTQLVKKGINADQIKVESKGSTEPQIICDPCTEDEHAKNRFAKLLLIAK
jgi:outer membrane protein OmpA-like peptidoglycan-associated protein